MKITKQDLINMGCDPEYVDDWLDYRKQKKKPITSSVIKRMQTEADKAGIAFADAVRMCAEGPWIGFKASYVNDQGQQQAAKQNVKSALRDIGNTNW